MANDCLQPNLQPPITTVAAALAYKSQLQALAPSVTFLMTLYMDPSITPTVIAEAARAGISGVKVYPAGVTTNSDAGVVDLQAFYPTIAAMQDHDLVLNLHGEVPSTPAHAAAYHRNDPSGTSAAATVMNAEPLFLPTLHRLHADFPRLRIVLEHCTTGAAIAAVNRCGPSVAGTITAHHLYLTIDDVVADSLNFCKPVAKLAADRVALLRAVADPGGKFFFGSDSAPHAPEAKRPVDVQKKAAAGCFTQGWAVHLVVGALKEASERGWVTGINKEILVGFLSGKGRKFYGEQAAGHGTGSVVLKQGGERIANVLHSADERTKVIPFRFGEATHSLAWVS